MLETLHVYDDVEPKPGALNMAVDEALLADATTPVLRFYRWQQPSISFGYFGRHSEAASEANGREVVRRWTGGGIVPHGDDLTYSVIIPKADPYFAKSSLEIYGAVHDAIRRALETNEIGATLAGAAAARISENCFANPVRADVMSGGRKVAGAAHRRSRAGLLHQGSIQHDQLPERFRDDFAQALCRMAELRTLSREILASAASIAENKYATVEWLTRR